MKYWKKIIVCPTLRSFCIDDILSHKTAALQRGGPPSLPGIVMFSIVISIARYHNIFHQYCHKYCPPSMQGIVPQFVVFFISIVFCTKCSGYHLCYQLGNFTSWEGHFSISNAPPPPWPHPVQECIVRGTNVKAEEEEVACSKGRGAEATRRRPSMRFSTWSPTTTPSLISQVNLYMKSHLAHLQGPNIPIKMTWGSKNKTQYFWWTFFACCY